MSGDARYAKAEWEREKLDGLVVELADALGKRRYAALPALATRMTRCALADPARTLAEVGPAHVSLDELVSSLWQPADRRDVPPEALLALADLVNAFECIGAPLRTICAKVAASWLGEVERFGVHVGFAAYALNVVPVAYRIAGVSDGNTEYRGHRCIDSVEPALEHVIHAIRSRHTIHDGLSVVHDILRHYGDLHAAGKVDEPTLLWLARLVFHDLGKRPLGAVAAETHTMAWRIADEQAAEAVASVPEGAKFPIGATIGGGAYRVDAILAGDGYAGACHAIRAADGAPILISEMSRSPYKPDTLRPEIAYRIPGVLELAFVGTFDAAPDVLAVVEVLPEGEWVPTIVPHDRAIPIARAVRLGRSAGTILARAAEAGIVMGRIRPEYMWARGDEVVGLTARAETLFAKRSRGTPMLDTLFDRYYFAPETVIGPADDRSIAFSLAVMIAEWAMGRYPFASLWKDHDLLYARHLPLEVPPDLAAVLGRALRREPAARPRLAEFLADLAPFAGT